MWNYSFTRPNEDFVHLKKKSTCDALKVSEVACRVGRELAEATELSRIRKEKTGGFD